MARREGKGFLGGGASGCLRIAYFQGMALLPPPIPLRLPAWSLVLIAYCALYTGLWGLVMLLNPEGYYDFSQLDPSYFPPSTAFWGWFGVGGLFFYGLYPFIYRRAPYYALASAIFSAVAVGSIAYMLFVSPLTGQMAAIHLSGDLAGLIGFGAAAILDFRARRKA